MALSVVNWNVQWATPRSERSPEILRRIGEDCPEVVCLTETDCGLLCGCGGYVISAGPYWGQSVANKRRKVLLWSRQPWIDVDCLGSQTLPPGRFIAGTTETSVGSVRVIGVCIPYGMANVQFGTKSSRPWQDHEQYLNGLGELLTTLSPASTIVLGDFNQPLAGRSSVPHRLREKLRCAFPPDMSIATARLNLKGKSTIDHIALGADLAAESLGVISNLRDSAKPLSDHFGVVANLSSRNPAPEPPTEE